MLVTMENGLLGGWGLLPRNIRELETKLPKHDAEKFTKKVTKTAKNSDNCPSNLLKSSNP